MTSTTPKLVATFVAGVAVSLGVLAVRARAAGIPDAAALTYTGYLENPDGTPVTGTKGIGLSVYDAPTKGKEVCALKPADIEPVAGRFQLELPSECTDAVKANPDLWVEVQVEGSLLGRTKLGAVPYAVEAAHATSADSADTVSATAWAQAPFEASAPIAAFPDGRFGNGFEYSNMGPLTCLRGLLGTSAANYTGVIATLPKGSRPSAFLNVSVAAAHGTTAVLEFHTDGTVYFRDIDVPADSWVSLAGVCFPNQ